MKKQEQKQKACTMTFARRVNTGLGWECTCQSAES